MTHAQALDAIEAGLPASRILRAVTPMGFSEAYFERLALRLSEGAGEVESLFAAAGQIVKLGDDPAFGYRAQAVGCRIRGRWAQAAALFLKAADVGLGIRRWQHAVGAVDCYGRLGRPEEAARLAKKIKGALRGPDFADLRARVDLNLGNALVWADDYPRARNAYLRAQRGLSGSLLAAAELGLATTFLFGGDPERALALASKAKAFFDDHGLSSYSTAAESTVAYAQAQRGELDYALLAFWRLREELQGDAFWGPRLHELVADVSLRLNLTEDAKESYGQGLKSCTPLGVANCWFGLAQCAEAEGGGAEDAYRKARAAYLRLGNMPWALAAEVGLARVPGKFRRNLEADLRRMGSPYHLAEFLLDQRRLTEAHRIIKRFGYQELVWRVHALYAEGTSGRRRYGHWERMMAAIQADRLRRSTLASRASLWRDRAGSVARYLRALLEDGRTEEVLEIVSEMRAATLLDELLGGADLDPSTRASLQEIRAATLQAKGDGPSRKAENLGGLPRTLPQILRQLGIAATPKVEGAAILLDHEGELVSIEGGVARGSDSRNLAEELRWWAFELQEPMLARDADPAEANNVLDRIRLMLPPVRASLICPDGVTWSLPWSALMGREMVVTPIPGGRWPTRRVGGDTVWVWVGDTHDLPLAETEVNQVIHHFPNARVFRSRSEVDEARGQSCDWLHVVGHASLNSDNPMFSTIEFTDGPLFAVEIARSNMRIGGALLNACDTGKMSVRLPNEPDGLVRAFLSCGAEAVVGSLWLLDDEAACRFSDALYRDQGNLVGAVGNAREKLRSWRNHPYFWAGHLVFSGSMAYSKDNQ